MVFRLESCRRGQPSETRSNRTLGTHNADYPKTRSRKRDDRSRPPKCGWASGADRRGATPNGPPAPRPGHRMPRRQSVTSRATIAMPTPTSAVLSWRSWRKAAHCQRNFRFTNSVSTAAHVHVAFLRHVQPIATIANDALQSFVPMKAGMFHASGLRHAIGACASMRSVFVRLCASVMLNNAQRRARLDARSTNEDYKCVNRRIGWRHGICGEAQAHNGSRNFRATRSETGFVMRMP